MSSQLPISVFSFLFLGMVLDQKLPVASSTYLLSGGRRSGRPWTWIEAMSMPTSIYGLALTPGPLKHDVISMTLDMRHSFMRN